MLTYPAIDPVVFQLGPVAVHWYGLTYLIGFTLAWFCLNKRAKAHGFSTDQVSDILFYGALGVIIGGRLGYMLFYDFGKMVHHPISILFIWQGGMAFHGGLLGVIIAMVYGARKFHKTMAQLTDFIVPVVPLGLGAGRIGNFINGELWGRVSDVPWAMVFPSGGPLPRHPSQLYEFFLEGVLLFLILWIYSRKERPPYAVSGLFLLLYGVFRWSVEFFRQPDAQIGFVAFDWLTRGQLLSIPMIVIGGLLIVFAYKRSAPCNNI